eukprot:6189985-Pleurochrysis_carterae.AAC.2
MGKEPEPSKGKKVEVDFLADGFPAYIHRSTSALFFQNTLNILMLCTPLCAIYVYNGWNQSLVFVFALLAIAPFAERLSFVTEQLAMHTSDTLGGLLNATFGNVTELIVSLFALQRGMLRIVQVSLLGSILSNLLLVLGCAFFAGGEASSSVCHLHFFPVQPLSNAKYEYGHHFRTMPGYTSN